jgi:DNA-binding NarL/FixJ family response regulator
MRTSDATWPAAADVPAFTILVVDDHAAIRETVTTLLAAEYPHCRLLGTGSAEDALDLCRTEHPELVILDITLPGMDGFEATRRIKELCPRTVIVMHSSSDQPVYQAASLAAGASAFVGKGRSSRRLVPVIASLMPPRAARNCPRAVGGAVGGPG